MKILVTGAKGFVGKNLCWALKNIQAGKDKTHPGLTVEAVFEYDIDSTPEELDAWCEECDFVFNLAGVNRPKEQSEFMEGNFGFASILLDTLKKHKNTCPVMLSSSQQASLAGRFGNSEYGRSKKAGEDLFLEYGKDTGAKVLVYRFPNLFGKWCRPNYNSAVATFCNAFANDLPYTVNDPSVELELLYIDDLVDEMIAGLEGNEHHCEFDELDVLLQEDGRYCYCPITHKVTLGEIVDLLRVFAEQPKTLMIPEIPANSFAKKLYSTYLSYLPYEKTAFPLKMNVDDRGSFTELVHTLNAGQVSINISKPGITKGQHWHNTKFEQFIVVKGHGLIQQRCVSPLPTSPSRGGEKLYNTASPILYEQLKEKAESMRQTPTKAESVMWQMLRGKQLDSKFRRQHIIDEYIVDFVCLEKQLIVEIDGGYHKNSEQQELDIQRTNFLQSKGFCVLRFTNDEVIGDAEGTIGIVNNALSHLSTLEGGAGGGLILNWFVSGDNIQAVHMLPGYTHNIINLSDTEDLVTVMYCNEIFNPQKPDTFFEPV